MVSLEKHNLSQKEKDVDGLNPVVVNPDVSLVVVSPVVSPVANPVVNPGVNLVVNLVVSPVASLVASLVVSLVVRVEKFDVSREVFDEDHEDVSNHLIFYI